MSTHDEDLTIKATESDEDEGPQEAQEPDAEGHSLLMVQLARTIHEDRLREAAEAARREPGRDRPTKEGHGFLGRR